MSDGPTQAEVDGALARGELLRAAEVAGWPDGFNRERVFAEWDLVTDTLGRALRGLEDDRGRLTAIGQLTARGWARAMLDADAPTGYIAPSAPKPVGLFDDHPGNLEGQRAADGGTAGGRAGAGKRKRGGSRHRGIDWSRSALGD